MNKELMKAQTAQAMRTINRFAPQVSMPLEAPISRSNVTEDIYRLLSRSTLRKATDDELATIYAALKAAKGRNQ